MDNMGAPTWAADHHHVSQQGQHRFSDSLANYPPLSVELSDIMSLPGLPESASPVMLEDYRKEGSASCKIRKTFRGSNRSGTNDDVAAADQHHSERTEHSGKQKTRSPQMHNCYEKRRRDRISAKLNILRELIPNSQKLDKASLLDSTSSYIKTLKQQVQVMQQMRWPLIVPPSTVPFVPQLAMNSCLTTGMNTDLSAFCPPFQPPWVAAGAFASMPFLPPNPYSHSDWLRCFQLPCKRFHTMEETDASNCYSK